MHVKVNNKIDKSIKYWWNVGYKPLVVVQNPSSDNHCGKLIKFKKINNHVVPHVDISSDINKQGLMYFVVSVYVCDYGQYKVLILQVWKGSMARLFKKSFIFGDNSKNI